LTSFWIFACFLSLSLYLLRIELAPGVSILSGAMKGSGSSGCFSGLGLIDYFGLLLSRTGDFSSDCSAFSLSSMSGSTSGSFSFSFFFSFFSLGSFGYLILEGY